MRTALCRSVTHVHVLHCAASCTHLAFLPSTCSNRKRCPLKRLTPFAVRCHGQCRHPQGCYIADITDRDVPAVLLLSPGIFQTFDADGSGAIATSELGAVLEKLGRDPDEGMSAPLPPL